MVGHTYNPSYWGEGCRMITSSSTTWAKFKKLKQKGWSVAQVVESLCSTYEALGLIPSERKTEREREGRKEGRKSLCLM
jgi:hypothetical protein